MSRDEQILSLAETVRIISAQLRSSSKYLMRIGGSPGRPAQMFGRGMQVIEFDDLLSYGWLGAIKAVDSFDSKRGTRLNTLASHKVRGSILDYLRSLDPVKRSSPSTSRPIFVPLVDA